jgi:hypothetical protein
MNHVLLGAAIPLLVCAAIFVARGRRASLRLLILGPLAAGLSGAWAVVPDMPRVFGAMERYVAWHHARWCNVFWGHCWIDDGEVDRPWYPLAFVAVGVVLLVVAVRELWLRERERAGDGEGR